MQKLSVKLKNTPTDTPQVCSSVSLGLNREETLSVQDKVLADNISDVDLRSGKSGQDLRVPVLNMRGELLMPTKPAKARHLLEQDKAEVVMRKPFTIKLKYPTGEAKQDITLGVDAGYSHVGFSVITEKQELMSGELKLRNDVSKKLTERRMYRRNRRNRKWYRKPRFLNRKRESGWFAPSIRHKLQSHVRMIEKLKEVLPISRIIVEVASFDTQKMQNPEIKGVEYQQGELQGYEVRQYLLEKWSHKCAYCGKTDVPLEVEHIVPKSRGGTDRVSNLTISCHKCNQKKNNQTAEEFGHSDVQQQAKEPLKAVAFMNQVRWKLINILKEKHGNIDVGFTFGSRTKYDRIKIGLEKSHVNDAFVMAGGNSQKRVKSYRLRQTRRNNRSLQLNRKGFKPSIRRTRYKMQPNDLVKFNGLFCRVKGVFNYGEWVGIVTELGEILNTKVKNVEVVKYGKGLFA